MGRLADAWGSAKGDNEAGTYMSGNILSKALDAVSTVGYAAAGATDAALSGENVLEGAGKGIQGRQSFVDTFKNHNMPNILALPLGIAADVLMPVAPGIGMVTGAMKGSARMARLEGVLARASTEHRTLAGIVAKGITGLEDATKNAARATDAVKGAHVPMPDAETAEKLINSADEGPQNPVFKWLSETGWGKGLHAVKTQLLDPFKKHLLEPVFGDVGAMFTKRAEAQLNLERELEGELLSRGEHIMKLSPKDHNDLFMLAATGERLPAGKEHLAEALASWKAIRADVFGVHKAAGTRQILGMHTMFFRHGLKAAQRDGVVELARLLKETASETGGKGFIAVKQTISGEGRTIFVPEKLYDRLAATQEGKFALQLLGDGATIDLDSRHIVSQLRHKEHYIPFIMRGEKRDKTVKRMLPETMQFLQHHLPEGTPIEEIQRRAEQMLNDQLLQPGDITKALQHDRHTAWKVPNPEDFVTDPKVWFQKFARDNSNLMARGHVWGAGDSKFYDVMNRYDELHGLGHAKVDLDKVTGPAITGRDTLKRGFAVLTNASDDPTSPFVRTMGHISDFLYLGPRTILLQATTLANHAGMSGIANSLAGVGITMSDSRIGKITRRIGIVLPNNLDAMMGSGNGGLRRWNFVLKGVGHADAKMRMFAAVAGGLDAAAREEKILKLVAGGKVSAATKEAAYFERAFGVSTKELLKGTKLADNAIMDAMRATANKTNFTGGVTELPKVVQGNTGKFFMKFKAFSLQQSEFMGTLLKEGRTHGNWTPLLRYAAMFPWVYKDVLKATNALRNPDKQLDPHEQPLEYLKNLLMIGALGYWGDAAMAMGSDSEALGLGLVAGPNSSAALKMKQGAKDLLPWRFDPGKAAKSLQPQSVNQARNLWENSQ